VTLVACGAVAPSVEPARPSATPLPSGSAPASDASRDAPPAPPIAAPTSLAPAASSAAAAPSAPPASLLVTARWLPIHERPDRGSPRVGLSRRGQRVPLSSAARATHPSSPCRGGWYAVAPRGFACAGADATLGEDRGAEAAAALLPDASRSLPFRVGAASFGPRYRRPPTAGEQAVTELDLTKLTRTAQAEPPLIDPSALAALRGREPRLLFARGTYASERVAWARELAGDGRAFVVTPDGAILPKDRVTPLDEPPAFGADLAAPGASKLPVALVVTEDARRLEVEGDHLVEREPLARRSVIPVDGGPVTTLGVRLLRARGGGWVRASDVAWAEAPASLPVGVGPDARWVRASVGRGTLLAMRGLTPVRVFAMSPGAGGVGQGVTHGTPLGRFMVSWKHLTADMSGEEGGVRWSVDEVPWVAYYLDGYAVHGAYWHDGFGRPRSHGCLNLTPADARWLFGWMDPQLPEGWYAVAAHPTLRPATIIDVAP